jgi:hypothetical protein
VIDAIVDCGLALPLKLRRCRMGLIMFSPIMVILALPLVALSLGALVARVFADDPEG